MKEIVTLKSVIFLLSILAFIVFIVFFYRVVKHIGLEKLKKLTVVLLVIFTGIIVLNVVGLNLMNLLPVQFIFGLNKFLALAIVLGLPVFCIIAITKIRKKNSIRYLKAVWLFIAFFNIADLVWSVSQLFFYDQVPGNHGVSFSERLAIAAYVLFQPLVLLPMIYPFCWMIISTISLFKIRKEKRRSLAAQAAS